MTPALTTQKKKARSKGATRESVTSRAMPPIQPDAIAAALVSIFGFRFGVWGLGVWGFGVRVWGFGFRGEGD